METEYRNVINAAKAWYRGLTKGCPRREKALVHLLPTMSPLERSLAHMVKNMLAAEKKGRIGADVVHEVPPKTPGGGKLRIVK